MSELIVADTPDKIQAFRLLALRSALKLEVRGLKKRGESAFSIIKREFKLRGTKASVLAAFEAVLRERGILSGDS